MDGVSIEIDSSLKSKLKNLVDKLREGDQDVQEQSYRKFMETLDPFEVAEAENQLSKEGWAIDDMLVLCDAHIRYMADITETEEELLELPGHPIHTLMEEHAYILGCVSKARDSSIRLASGKGDESDHNRLRDFPPFLSESRKHFQREENVLFPYMERHGITGPPARMWAEHDVLRRKEKEIVTFINEMSEGASISYDILACSISQLLSLLNTHFHKENHVLFPQALNVMDILEWNEVIRQFDDIGACSFVPHHAQIGFQPIVPEDIKEDKHGEVDLLTGKLTAEEVNMIFNALPVEITYVGEDDRVRYFSTPAERIFIRTEAVIGRKVQNCHPSKSLHAVQKIVGEFKSGERDEAEFWINMEGKKIHIRFYPIRDKSGNYRGAVEVVQNVTGIMELEGEKRLLDEE
ncbi:MAG: DUF438 domain-containing protein [Euryarchaeota archaeon]|nr:DUF438 domain-containing protein [Euryarchaeota archaeon]